MMIPICLLASFSSIDVLLVIGATEKVNKGIFVEELKKRAECANSHHYKPEQWVFSNVECFKLTNRRPPMDFGVGTRTGPGIQFPILTNAAVVEQSTSNPCITGI